MAHRSARQPHTRLVDCTPTIASSRTAEVSHRHVIRSQSNASQPRSLPPAIPPTPQNCPKLPALTHHVLWTQILHHAPRMKSAATSTCCSLAPRASDYVARHLKPVVVVSAAGCTSRLGVMRPEAHARPFESLPSRAYYMPAVLPMEVGQ